MKSKFTLLALLIGQFFFTAKAQITITDADMPVTGTDYIRDNGGNLTIIDLSVTGASSNWDYTGLTVNSTDTITYTTVSSTPLAYQFYFNNIILYSTWKADLALPAADFPIPAGSPVTITDVVNYYKKTSSAYYQVGFGASISGIPTSQRYDPRDKILSLPCNFGDNNNADFSWLISVPAVGAYGQDKNRQNEVDGWGTLQLPYATYNTLRVKSTVTGIDTFYVDQFGFGMAIPSTQYEYKWYANGEGEPVLTVNANDLGGSITATSANFKHTDPPLNKIAENAGFPFASVYPNPTYDVLNIQFPARKGEHYSLQIIDLNGKVLYFEEGGLAVQGISVSTSTLPQGYYQVKLVHQGNEINSRFVKL